MYVDNLMYWTVLTLWNVGVENIWNNLGNYFIDFFRNKELGLKLNKFGRFLRILVMRFDDRTLTKSRSTKNRHTKSFRIKKATTQGLFSHFMSNWPDPCEENTHKILAKINSLSLDHWIHDRTLIRHNSFLFFSIRHPGKRIH